MLFQRQFKYSTEILFENVGLEIKEKGNGGNNETGKFYKDFFSIQSANLDKMIRDT